jgi:hypothetical protein
MHGKYNVKVNRLRMFGKRVLRSTFSPKSEEVTGKWRKPHNEQLQDWYSSPNNNRVIKSTRMRRTGHVQCRWGKRNAYGVFVGTPEGKRPLERPKCKWEDKVKMDLNEGGRV